MRVENAFTKIAKSDAGQKFYKSITDPAKDKFMNTYLPICESAVVSSFYMISTAMQKKIDPESKQALQLQNILSLLFSVGLSIPLNKGVSKFGDSIIKNLQPELMKDGAKVVDGIKVGLPILNSILVSRFLVATGLVPLSSKIRDKIKEHKVNTVA